MDDDHNQRRIKPGPAAPDVLRTRRLPLRSDCSAAEWSEIDELRRRLDICQEITGIGDWVYDAASGAVTWSREVFRLMKRASHSGQMSFDEFLFYYESADSERLLEAMEAVILENGRREVEMRARLLDGESVRHCCTLLPLADRLGVVTGINGFLRDLGALDHAVDAENNRMPTRMVGVDTGDIL